MSAIQRGLYVTIGAADLAAEKVREIPGVSKFVEESKKFGEKSVLDHAREFEPKLREFGTELAARGEKAVARLREQGDEVRKQIANLPTDARKQIKEFPTTARKQIKELPTTARKQVSELRGLINRTPASSARKPAAKATKAPSAVSN
jgi:vacuolar-type H+-ATPase subunit H